MVVEFFEVVVDGFRWVSVGGFRSFHVLVTTYTEWPFLPRHRRTKVALVKETKCKANPATDDVCVESRTVVLNSRSSPKTRIVLRKTKWSLSLFLFMTESQCNSPQLMKLQFTLQFILLNSYM